MKAKKKRNTFLNGLIWSSKGIAASVPNTLIVTYLAFYATNVLGIKATIVASMLLFTKLIDGVTDVISGVVIDNTHTRFGKGRPYDWCILLMGIFTILLFSAPQSGLTVQIIYLAIMYVMVQAVFSTLLETGDAVYLLRAFPVEKERNTVFSIGVIVSQLFSITIGVILPILIASAGTDHAAWTKMVAMVMVLAAAIGMLRFFLVKEVVVDDAQKEVSEDKKVEKKEEKISFKEAAKSIFENPYILVFAAAIFVVVIASGLMNASMAYFFTYVIGDQSKMAVISIATYISLIMIIIFVPLANKFGKSRVMKFSLIIASAGALIRILGGVNIPIIFVGNAMMLFGVMPVAVYVPLFLFDIMDYGEWKTGKRVEGMYSAFPNFANKVATAIASSLGLYILGWAGYDGKAEVQSANTLRAINFIYNWIPFIMIVTMTVLIVVFYNIDKKLPAIRAELAERKAAEE